MVPVIVKVTLPPGGAVGEVIALTAGVMSKRNRVAPEPLLLPRSQVDPFVAILVTSDIAATFELKSVNDTPL